MADEFLHGTWGAAAADRRVARGNEHVLSPVGSRARALHDSPAALPAEAPAFLTHHMTNLGCVLRSYFTYFVKFPLWCPGGVARGGGVERERGGHSSPSQ